ncbi:MAG: hypothetical protein U0X91_05155 [Spirosomataceae bacterium]
MKKLLNLSVSTLMLLLMVQISVKAQKPISAEDKKAIVALFKDADPTMYRLQFNDGKEVYGKRQIKMDELEQIKKVRNPAGENGYVVLAVKDDGIMLIFAATKGKVESLLGREKAAKLNTIMTKYQR